MKATILNILCIVILCTILTLGLWPFHAPNNEVSWLRGRNGLQYGAYGTVMTPGVIQIASSNGKGLSGSVEIWLQPGRIWDSGTLLIFSMPGDLFRFSLHQSLPNLQVLARVQNGQNQTKSAGLEIKGVLHPKGPTFITVTTGVRGTAVYIDGILARVAPQFRLATNQLTGRLVLGDSTGQSDTWDGQLLGFAIYNRDLAPQRVLEHFETWTRMGSPQLQKEDGNIALYLFDEHAGNVVRNRANSGIDLVIPKKYVVLDQIFLQSFWTEFGNSWEYWSNVLKNIAGFVPLGFFFCARLSMARFVKRAALTAVVLGALVSLTIEILQSQLPTRNSGTTDIITNTLGTYVGVVLFYAARTVFARLC